MELYADCSDAYIQIADNNVQSTVALSRASSWEKNYQLAALAHTVPGDPSIATSMILAPLGQITRTFGREDKKKFIQRNLTYMGTAVRELLNVSAPQFP